MLTVKIRFIFSILTIIGEQGQKQDGKSKMHFPKLKCYVVITGRVEKAKQKLMPILDIKVQQMCGEYVGAKLASLKRETTQHLSRTYLSSCHFAA